MRIELNSFPATAERTTTAVTEAATSTTHVNNAGAAGNRPSGLRGGRHAQRRKPAAGLGDRGQDRGGHRGDESGRQSGKVRMSL